MSTKIEDNSNEDIIRFTDEIFRNTIETFNLLNDPDKLVLFLSVLTEEQKDKLYSHPLVDIEDGYDLLP